MLNMRELGLKLEMKKTQKIYQIPFAEGIYCVCIYSMQYFEAIGAQFICLILNLCVVK